MACISRFALIIQRFIDMMIHPKYSLAVSKKDTKVSDTNSNCSEDSPPKCSSSQIISPKISDYLCMRMEEQPKLKASSLMDLKQCTLSNDHLNQI
jgi:hypothetical protein